MNVRSICHRRVVVARPDDSLESVVHRMRDDHVGTVVVLDDAGRPVGLVTDRDLLLAVVVEHVDPRRPVSTAMSEDVRTVAWNVDVTEALEQMSVGHCRRLPVVAEDGKIDGIVSLDDVIRAIGGELELVGHVLAAQTPEGAGV